MTPKDDLVQRRAIAATKFRHLIIALIAIGVAMVGAALLYLDSYSIMSPALVVTVVPGVFVSVVLGGGLMAAGFYSSDSGIDETVADVARGDSDGDGEARG